MTLERKLLVLAVVALVFACNGTTSGGSAGSLTVTSDMTSLNNDGSLAHITVAVTDGQGHPATGSVTISATGGNLNNSGNNSATVALDAAGHATVSYACDFSFDTTHCGAGQITVTAVWSSVVSPACFSRPASSPSHAIPGPLAYTARIRGTRTCSSTPGHPLRGPPACSAHR